MSPNEAPGDVVRWLRQSSAEKSPAILGSLTRRRARCIRENCPACRSGEQHPSWVLCGRHKRRRFAVYVPEALVPEVQHCLDNGRAGQEQLYEAAPRYVKALKRAGAAAAETSTE